MKKQKKKLKKRQLKLPSLKTNVHKKQSRSDKGCYHPHINNDGSCCHCGEPDALFKGLKKNACD